MQQFYNQNYSDINLEPIEILIREKIGYVVSPKNLEIIPEIIENIFINNTLHEQIKKIRSETVYNIKKSAIIGADVIEKISNDL